MRNFLRGALALSLLLSYASHAPTSAQATQTAQATQIGQTRRGITAEDYYAFEFLGDPRLSPDGRWVAYVVTTVDQRQNRRLSQIWLAPADGSRPPRQFTTSPQSSTSPRWSPDGRTLAFLSARPEGGSQMPPSPSPTTSSTPGAQAAAGVPAPASTPGQLGTATTPGVPSALQTAAPAAEATPRTTATGRRRAPPSKAFSCFHLRAQSLRGSSSGGASV